MNPAPKEPTIENLKDLVKKQNKQLEQELARRKRVEIELEIAIENYRTLVENLNDVIYSVDLQGVITYVSPTIENLTQYTVEEYTGQSFFNFIFPEDIPLLTSRFKQLINGRVEPAEYRLLAKNGDPIPIRSSSRRTFKDGQVIGLNGIIMDIRLQKQAEEALQKAHSLLEQRVVERTADLARVNRMLYLLSDCNQAMVRASDEQELLQEICRLIVERGGYYMAWVGYVEHDPDKTVRPVAQAGIDEGYLNSIKVSWGDNEFGHGPTGTAISTKAPSVVTDIPTDPNFRPWAESAMVLGCKSAISLPLIEDGNAFGSLGIFSTQADAFNKNEIGLLLELAGDLAFGISSLREKTARLLAEENLQALANLQSAILNNAAYLVISTDQEGVITSMNPAAVKATGYSAEECIGKLTPLIFHDPVELANRAREFSEEMGIKIEPGFETLTVRALHNLPNEYEWAYQRKDGSRFIVLLVCSALRNSEGEITGYLGIANDIHDYKQTKSDLIKTNQRLNALRSIDIAITSSYNVQLNLDVLIEQVLIQLSVDAADVLLLNPFTLTLEYAAGRGFRTRGTTGASVRLGESYAGRSALERRPIKVNVPDPSQVHSRFMTMWAEEAFCSYFAVPLVVKGQVKGVLETYHRKALPTDPDWVNFLETLAGQAAIAVESSQLFDNLQRSNVDLTIAYDATIEGWAKALDLRDNETMGHTLRVTEMCLQLSRAVGIPDKDLVHVRRGAILHDIGKMGIPDSILRKPDKLTDEEWKIMRQHPLYAYEILTSISYLRPAIDIPYCHHEKWDGSGYPRGLQGQQIPLTARVFALADVWDALNSDRPYRRAWSREEALQYIRTQAGIQFDPDIVKVFLNYVDGHSEL